MRISRASSSCSKVAVYASRERFAATGTGLVGTDVGVGSAFLRLSSAASTLVLIISWGRSISQSSRPTLELLELKGSGFSLKTDSTSSSDDVSSTASMMMSGSDSLRKTPPRMGGSKFFQGSWTRPIR